jgi:peptidyl-tRNA hydrolase
MAEKNLYDDEALALQRAAQEDPWVLYLVVRRAPTVSLEELLVAAARATVGVTALARDPAWAEAFRHWSARSFRKVCLRASEREWAALQELPGFTVEGAPGGAELLRALPPRLKSAREKLLVKLQAYTPALEAFPAASALPLPEAPTALLVVNSAVPMSAGKLAAQVGHAVLLAAELLGPRDPGALRGWAGAGHPCAVRRAEGERWASLRREAPCVAVRDAGLTEVPPGTETVLALAPQEPSRWGADLHALERVGCA